MDIPAGFRRWRFHWFECPACGHRDWRAYASASMARDPLRVVWRYWCERCGAFSALKQPMMPHLAAALVFLFIGPIAFVFVYRAMLAGLRFEWLVLIFAVFWIAQPLVILAITRGMFRYVPAA
jgi:hypothetical protein